MFQCNGVGTTENDKTIGDYLSGFWSFHTNKQGSNWLEINTVKLNSVKGSKSTYLTKIMIYRKDGEENWGWGISFNLDKNKKIMRKNFACLGSG